MSNDGYWLAPHLVRARFTRASTTYDAAAGAIDELRNRLLERLDLVRLVPERVLDLGCGTGVGARALQRRYRKAHILALDAAYGMARQADRRRGWPRKYGVIVADGGALPLREHSVDLVFSHLMLPWCNTLDGVFAEVARVLRPGGLFLFSSLGPDTARELRNAWRALDGAVHVHAFLDMHDVGDALLRNGFADPVMDVEHVTLTYRSFDALLSEARNLGVTNLAAGRPPGLGSRAQLDVLRNQYAALSAPEAPLPVTVEMVYGHAWMVAKRAAEPGGEVRVPLTQIGRRSRI
jgi:malonyl-CoA O-methyltransferase